MEDEGEGSNGAAGPPADSTIANLAGNGDNDTKSPMES